ncbi:putative effector of murein hydrolase LrgA [Actinobacillus pleuropneumoniae]|nr:putative effector of murein hydrolase LrgA [Actinobacillus pleuropneumoniae]
MRKQAVDFAKFFVNLTAYYGGYLYDCSYAQNADSLALLFAMLYGGKLLGILIPIGISESIWGMLLLFYLLSYRGR